MGSLGSGRKNKLGDVVRIIAWVKRETADQIAWVAEITRKHKSEVIRTTLENYVTESAIILMEE